jgi:hypothetical protein
MADLLPVSLEEEIAAVEREIGLRKRVYPGRVQGKRMSQDRADREIQIMEAILDLLVGLKA